MSGQKVCIIAPSSLRYVPYLDIYTEVLDAAGVSYDIVYWDRFLLAESRPNATAFSLPGTQAGVRLLPGYWRYRRFLLDYFASRSYVKYIVLTAQVAVFISDFLADKDFLVDIRDYSHERYALFRMLENRLLSRAALVAISSPGFKEWLPEGREYLISHNLKVADLDGQAQPFDSSTRTISYIGAVGYLEANIKCIDAVADLEGWSLRYIGHGTQEKNLEDYVERRGLACVTFHGAYSAEQKPGFYESTNFVLGCYGADSILVRTLLPNRLYESCIYKRPIIVNTGMYVGGLVEKFDIGIVCELDNMESLSKSLLAYYDADFYRRYCEKCDDFLKIVSGELATFRRKVTQWLGV